MAKKRNEKRDYGDGSIFRRENGTYRGYTRINANGKQIKKYVSGKTKEEVAEKLEQLKDNVPQIIKNKDTTFGEQMLKWLMLHKRYTISSRNFYRRMKDFRKHIEPVLGHMKTHDIGLDETQLVFNMAFKKGLMLSTVKPIKHILSQFFEFAVDKDLCKFNPVLKVKLRKRDYIKYQPDEEEKYKAIPLELREFFLEKLNDHKLLKPLCIVAMYSGLRIGEILALKWNTVNFEKNVMYIKKSVTREYDFDDEGKVISSKTVLSDTKTACSVRENPMPKLVTHSLKEYYDYMKTLEQATGINYTTPSQFIFCTYRGTLRSYSAARSVFKKFLEDYGLYKKGFFFHGLRNTFSTMLFESGENPKVVQLLLGHRQLETTLKHYNSINKSSSFSRAMDTLNESGNKFILNPSTFYQANKKPDANIEDELEDASLEDLEKLLNKVIAKKKRAEAEM